MLHDAIETVAALQRGRSLRAEHFLHLRCEVAHETIVETIEALIDHPLARLLSLMDHTPGQRQFASIEKYYEYYQGKFGYTDAEMAAYIAQKTDLAARFADPNRRRLSALDCARKLPQASHDDATLAHVGGIHRTRPHHRGIPDDTGGRDRGDERGMAVVMGAPMSCAAARIRATPRRATSPPPDC